MDARAAAPLHGKREARGLGAPLGWGGFYDGSDLSLRLNGPWRAGGHLSWTAVRRDAVGLPSGRFTALTASTRIRYAFTTRRDLLAYAQYNDESRTADIDLRFHGVPQIGNNVYVVWTSGHTMSRAFAYPFPRWSALRRPLNNALVVKVVYRVAP